MKKVLSAAKNMAFVLLILFICYLIFAMSQGRHVSFAGYQVLRVLTSSMEPVIPGNTCIIIKEVPEEQLKPGDIITFISDDPDIKGYYNTHRICELIEENGETLYVTRGDNNPEYDQYPVYADQIAGIYVGELPGGKLLGKAFTALSDNRIYFLVVMLPLTVCLLSYLWQMIGFVTGRYKEESEDEENT